MLLSARILSARAQ